MLMGVFSPCGVAMQEVLMACVLPQVCEEQNPKLLAVLGSLPKLEPTTRSEFTKINSVQSDLHTYICQQMLHCVSCCMLSLAHTYLGWPENVCMH